MSDTKTKRKPGDASIIDYYHKLSPYNVIIQSAKQIKGAAEDLRRNANDMRADDTIGNDKYFHCKGNCEASKRGLVGEFSSTILSDAREYYQTYIKGESAESANEDEKANKYGRNNAFKAPSCSQVCQKYRVKGINKKY